MWNWLTKLTLKKISVDDGKEKCPDCGHTEFTITARGGLAMNVICEKCGQKWWHGPGFGFKRL